MGLPKRQHGFRASRPTISTTTGSTTCSSTRSRQTPRVFACTGGARSAPPEDCGGVPGYARLLEILRDPSHSEHQEVKTWAGRRFDPEKFDMAAVNEKLGALSKRLRRRTA